MLARWRCCCSSAGAAWAEPADARGKLDERLDMALKNAAPDDLFGTFAKMFGAEAVVDPAVRGPVTIELHNVRARTLLDADLREHRLPLELSEPGTPPKLRVLPVTGSRGSGTRGKPPIKEEIDLKVTQADGRDVLKTYRRGPGRGSRRSIRRSRAA